MEAPVKAFRGAAGASITRPRCWCAPYLMISSTIAGPTTEPPARSWSATYARHELVSIADGEHDGRDHASPTHVGACHRTAMSAKATAGGPQRSRLPERPENHRSGHSTTPVAVAACAWSVTHRARVLTVPPVAFSLVRPRRRTEWSPDAVFTGDHHPWGGPRVRVEPDQARTGRGGRDGRTPHCPSSTHLPAPGRQ